jgi:xanthine dehydrogenase small subunit
LAWRDGEDEAMSLTVKTFGALSEAAQALSADRGARFLGGGTFVMRAVNEGDVSITTVIRSTDPALHQIRGEADRVVIGAGVTMSALAANRDTEFLAPAALAVGGPAVRNMASVGGNLFARSPYGDLATALLALDATVHLVEGASRREVPLADFLSQRSGHEPRRVVAAVSVRRPQALGAFRFEKLTRVKPHGASVIAIAAHLPQSGGRVHGAAIAYCAMAPGPVRVPAVERALEGKSLDETGISAACAAAAEGLDPPTDAIASGWYRREVAPVLLKRLLLGRLT